MNKIAYNINLTFSKIMGGLLIIGGVALGFYLESESVAISLVGVGATLITVKTIVQNKKS